MGTGSYISDRRMTHEEFARLWYLFDIVTFELRDLKAIDACLAKNSYASSGTGWTALIEWIEKTYSVSSSPTT
jgi:hypothetical protein